MGTFGDQYTQHGVTESTEPHARDGIRMTESFYCVIDGQISEGAPSEIIAVRAQIAAYLLKLAELHCLLPSKSNLLPSHER